MKNLSSYLICGLALISTACSDNYDPEYAPIPSLAPHFLGISELNFFAPAEKSTQSLRVYSLETSWKFSETPAWAAFSPSSGNADSEVTLETSENNAADGRTAIIHFNSANPSFSFSKALEITQAATTPYINVTPELQLNGSAASYSLEIDANCKWTAESNVEWMTVAPDIAGGKLGIYCTSNPGNNYRTANIIISYGNKISKRVNVTQLPADVKASDDMLTFENVASRYEAVITAETSWYAIASDDWIRISPNSGDAGETTVSIEVTPNTQVSKRFGSITVYSDSFAKFAIEIQQQGLYIEVGDLQFSSLGETKTLDIRSNTEWEVLQSPDWVTLSKTSGSGTDVISVTVPENPRTSPRSGEIRFGKEGRDISCSVTVTQAARTIEVGTSVIEFSDKGGSRILPLVSDGAWTSTKDSEWFVMNPESGNGNSDITVTAEENITADERFGNIWFSVADKSEKVTVHQQAKYFTVDSQALHFGSLPSSHIIEITGNNSWNITVESDPDWIQLSETSGEGPASIKLEIADNPSVNRRSAMIVIESSHLQSVRIPVTQNPRYLNVSTDNILFFAKESQSDHITIDTDGVFKISKEGDWFNVTTENNEFFVTASRNNSNSMREGKVIVALTDLTEGSLSIEIPVQQAAQGGSFIINPYPSDKDFGAIGDGSLTLKVNGYSSDKNWNASSSASLKVVITGYSDDNDWNWKNHSEFSPKIIGFGIDKDRTPVKGEADIDSGGFNDKGDWSPVGGGAEVDLNGYESEENDWNVKEEPESSEK